LLSTIPKYSRGLYQALTCNGIDLEFESCTLTMGQKSHLQQRRPWWPASSHIESWLCVFHLSFKPFYGSNYIVYGIQEYIDLQIFSLLNNIALLSLK
jgi:hypothetical protein